MKTIYYRDYAKTEEAGYNLHLALAAAKREKAGRLVMEPGVYRLDPAWCDERYLAFSNHETWPIKRVGALIEDMEDFEIDFAGATLDCRGHMTPVAILRSKNITIRNLTLENPTTGMLQAKVVAHGDGYMDIEPMYGRENFKIGYDGLLYCDGVCYSLFPVGTNIEFNGTTGELEAGTGDHTYGYVFQMKYKEIDGGLIRVTGVKRYPPIGNILIISATRRMGAGIFALESENVRLEDVNVHSCYGMGFIAQVCRNITLRRFNTVRKGDRWVTADADATHFVDCDGLVDVQDCLFEGQLDDALNIHGIYTRIVSKAGRDLFVREMHGQQENVRIYKPGDRVQMLKPDPLIPYTEKTVEAVEYLNGDTFRLTMKEDLDDVAVGDDVENISHNAELIFRHNIVRNNRARGMLVAARGKMVIEDCYFHSSGTAVKFESDGAYWFESGGTSDVVIRNNEFDRCKHAAWGVGVVECQARATVEDGRYFHQKIAVTGNTFRMFPGTEAAHMDNVASFTFRDNVIVPADGQDETVIFTHHVGKADVQDGMKINAK